MKVAMVLPSLSQTGPIIVAKDIIEQLKNEVDFEVYYFEDKVEMEFDCPTRKINMNYIIKDVDIIHSHMFLPDIYTSKIKNIKTISTLHCYMYSELSDKRGKIAAFILEKYWCYILNSIDKIVCLSESMKKYYEKYIDKNKLVIINNGRDVAPIKNDKKANEDEEIIKFKGDKTLIGIFCILKHRKGIDRIINMLSITDKYKLLIVGDGPDRKKLEKLAKKKGVIDKIFWVGFQKEPHLYYPYIDLSIMASRSEGVSLFLLEMGINKIPTACVELDIFTELYDPSELSFFKADDPNSMLEACEKIDRDKKPFIENLYIKTKEQFSEKKMGEKYLELYKSLI